MKKVVLTYSSGPLATSVFEFLRALNEQQPLFVSAVFLTQLVYASVWSDASGLGDLASAHLAAPLPQERRGRRDDRRPPLVGRQRSRSCHDSPWYE